jgi:hypothetical protein
LSSLRILYIARENQLQMKHQLCLHDPNPAARNGILQLST